MIYMTIFLVPSFKERVAHFDHLTNLLIQSFVLRNKRRKRSLNII